MYLRLRTVLLSISIVAGLAGCVSDPAFEQPMGDSVRRMISVQSFEPAEPTTEPSPMLYDGSATQRSIETYRTRNAVRPQTQTIRVGK